MSSHFGRSSLRNNISQMPKHSTTLRRGGGGSGLGNGATVAAGAAGSTRTLDRHPSRPTPPSPSLTPSPPSPSLTPNPPSPSFLPFLSPSPKPSTPFLPRGTTAAVLAWWADPAAELAGCGPTRGRARRRALPAGPKRTRVCKQDCSQNSQPKQRAAAARFSAAAGFQLDSLFSIVDNIVLISK